MSDDRRYGLIGNTGIKVPCRVATTAAITLSATQTIDGVAVVSGDRVLVKDQSSGVDNGIYVVDTGDWSRAADADGSYDFVSGSLVFVTVGTSNSGFWYVSTTGDIVVGTDSITFTRLPNEALAADLNMGGYKITALGAGTAAADAVRLSQLQNSQGQTLGTIAGTDTITAVGSPTLTAYANGQVFYFVAAGTNTGATTINIDSLGAKSIYAEGAACVGGEIVSGKVYLIRYNGTQFDLLSITDSQLTIPDTTPIVKGATDATKKLRLEVDGQTTGQTRVVASQDRDGTMGLAEDQIFPVSASVAANAMTLTLNPCVIAFRSSTITSGAVNVRAINTAITTTISSGSTGGTASGVTSRILVLAMDNAGTVELAWCNSKGDINLFESGLISTTAEGGAGAADSANVIYSTTARSNLPFRIVGIIESTQATAGTWASSPTAVIGSNPLASVLKVHQIRLGTPTSASGTSVNFTGIQTWVKRITINFVGLSTNGTSDYLIQLGTSGGVVSSGYLGTGTALVPAGTVTATNYTAGFGLPFSTAAAVAHGSIVLSLVSQSANTWACSGAGGRSDAAVGWVVGGSVSLSEILDRVRITTAGGADTFDAGTINITYE